MGPSALPWPDFRAEVLALYQPPLRAPATLKMMSRILAELGGMNLETTADLRPSLIARWIAAQHDRGRSANTILGNLSYLRAACQIAVACGWLERSPFQARRVWIRAEPNVRGRAWPLADLRRLLASLAAQSAASWSAGRLHALVATVAYTGLRKSEALHLLTEDVDLPAAVLRIVQRQRRLKTVGAGQPVPIPPELAPTLADWLPRCGCAWVFPGGKRAGPWTGGSPGYKALDQVKAAARVVGLEGLTLQDLRHSWATHAESAWNLSEPAIQRVLRHTTPLTQRHYRHADLANLRRIGAAVRFA